VSDPNPEIPSPPLMPTNYVADVSTDHTGWHNKVGWLLNTTTGVNVKVEGAVGDGLTDDTAAVQSALNKGAGGTVLFPPGVYLLGQIRIPVGTTVRGAGSSASTLKVRAGLNDDFIVNTAGDSDITIESLAINGNKGQQTSGATARGIYLQSCARLVMDRLHIFDVEGHGIHLSNVGTVVGQRASNMLLERCGSSTTNTYGSNLATTNVTDLTLTDIYSYDSYKAGFRLSGQGIVLNGCIARRNGNGGIVTVSGDNLGCTVNGGIYADNGFVGGVGYGNADGIRLVGSNSVIITGAVCSGNYGSGIGLHNTATNITIVGGVYKNNGKQGGTPGAVEGRDGITLNGNTSPVTDVTIVGVRCYDDQATKTQQYGVRLKGNVDFVAYTSSSTRGNLTGGYSNTSTTGTTIATSSLVGS